MNTVFPKSCILQDRWSRLDKIQRTEALAHLRTPEVKEKARLNRIGKGKYVFTPEIDKQIRDVYRTMTGNGEVAHLAERLCLPRWRVSRRAREIGAYEPLRKEPDWSERELMILENVARFHPETIRKKLFRAGFTRSATAIILKRKRMRMLRNLEGQSANSLGECFGVDPHVITRWIKTGLLRAERRGTMRTEVQGGDMYFIKDKWVRQFVIENIGIIDIRKVEKLWFLDVLVNR